MPWVYDPTSGGLKITMRDRERIKSEIELYARNQPWYKDVELIIKFKSQFCYIQTKDRNSDNDTPMPLCRLRSFSGDKFGLALYLYSDEKYEDTLMPNGEWHGNAIQAFKVAETFII